MKSEAAFEIVFSLDNDRDVKSVRLLAVFISVCPVVSHVYDKLLLLKESTVVSIKHLYDYRQIKYNDYI